MGKKVEAGTAKNVQTKVYPRCGLHRRYKGLVEPKTGCQACEEIYKIRRGGSIR
jgi:uncharacterized protein (DUF983 family)